MEGAKRLEISSTKRPALSPDTDDPTLNIADILDRLTDVQDRYYEIGTMLHLRRSALSSIRNKRTTDAMSMSSVIDEWLKRMYDTGIFGPPTWKMLVDVVASPNGGNNMRVAEKIAYWHLSDTHTLESQEFSSTKRPALSASTDDPTLSDPTLNLESKPAFPYLETPGFSKDKREVLVIRLKLETDDIKREFGVLVGKTLDNLSVKGKTVTNLRALLTSLNERNGNKLTKKLKKITDLSEAFIALNEFWSFFEYYILRSIIESYCRELAADLDKYLSSLKDFCKRRVCEIPGLCSKKVKSKAEILYIQVIQVDKSFVSEINRLKMKNLKELGEKLGQLLGTKLTIHMVSDGSIVICFNCLHEFDVIFPLCTKQEEELQQIGVTKIYSQKKEYFRYTPPLIEASSEVATVTFTSFVNVSVSIISDTIVENNERCYEVLSPGGGEPVLTSPNMAAVTIEEDSNNTGGYDCGIGGDAHTSESQNQSTSSLLQGNEEISSTKRPALFTGTDDPILNIDDKPDILDRLTDVQYHYYEIGRMLHLNGYALNYIRNESTSDAMAMSLVIEEWLKMMYNTDRFGPPTWKMLEDAVASPNGGNNERVAEEIARRRHD